MIKTVIFSFIVIIFTSCSMSPPKNEWQYKSANAFSSYTENFLNDNNALAKNDLNRAIQHSKKSANFTQLAKIYLGKCALNISVGVDDRCQEYIEIKDLVQNKTLDAYYHFITLSVKQEDIKYLPETYREYAKNIHNSNYKDANKNIEDMPKITSSLLCSVLIDNKLSKKTRDKVRKLTSFYGYKKAVLFWLEEEKKLTKDVETLKQLNKRIAILKKL